MKQTLVDLKISVIYNRDNELELDIKQLLFSDERKRDGPEYEPDRLVRVEITWNSMV